MPFRLETGRLVLREWAANDRPAFRGIATNPSVMRFISDGTPWSDERIDGFLERQAAHARERGFCLAALTERPDGTLIGLAGLQPMGTSGEIEVGWWPTPSHWGRGLASEAGRALLAHGFETRALERIVAITHPRNVKSRAVMQRLGMRFERETTGRELGLQVPDVEIVLYAKECHDA